MDALKSFTHITDNLPSWLTQLDELSVQVTKQHARFTRLTHFTEVKLARKKHDSTESLRPKADDNPEPTAIVITDASVPPTSQPVSNNAIILADTSRNILRKRKPSLALSGASGPQRYRTRSMIVVYYDSDIQDAFEMLVRNIAGARNNLRKGKTAASFKNRMAAMGMGGDRCGGAGMFPLLDPKMRLKIGINRQVSGTSTDAAFETMDQDLEKAQSLCEIAAHQMLRDGDCRLEIEETKERVANCLKIAKEEVEKLKEEAKEEEAQEAREAQETVDFVPETTTHEQPRPEPIEIVIYEKVEHPPIKHSNFAGTGAIEVDNESDASSVHVDLSAIRRTRRG
jgi:hypothetical protein